MATPDKELNLAEVTALLNSLASSSESARNTDPVHFVGYTQDEILSSLSDRDDLINEING